LTAAPSRLSWRATCALAAVALLLAACQAVAAPPSAGPTGATQEATVIYVVDGDTIHVDIGGQEYRVRYIGIDAPEIPRPADVAPSARWQRGSRFFLHTPEAGDAARRLNVALVAGRDVRLELDRQVRDDYQRLLAYVWVGDTMINAEMVRRGYAEAMSIPPDFRHRALLLQLQREARAARRGLWQR